MKAVFYDPNDGRIVSSVQASKLNIEAHHQPYVEVADLRDDYDVTHRVQDGKVVPL